MPRIALICLFVLLAAARPVEASEHWARGDLDIIKSIYGIEVTGDLDRPADIELQLQLFRLAGLSLIPQEGLNRYNVFYELVKKLNILSLSEDECRKLLSEFKDACHY